MLIDPFSIIITLGIIQGFVFAVTILRMKKGNGRANQILALLLVLVSISFINIILYRTNFYLHFVYFIKFSIHMQLLFGPLFYFYVKTIITDHRRFTKQNLWHFIPFFIALLYLTPFYLKSSLYKIFYAIRLLSNDLIGAEKYENLLFPGLVIIHVLIYFGAVLFIACRHENHIKPVFSARDEMMYSWIKCFANLFVGVYLINLFVHFLAPRFLNASSLNCIYGVLGSISIFYLSVRGLQQPEIFYSTGPSDSFKPEKLTFKSDDACKYLDKLLSLMDDEKLYKDPNLTLSDLAKRLSISRTYLSQLINEFTGMNFFDFINSYRIKEVKLFLTNPEKDVFTIAALAADAGFQSRSSFNRIFKKAVHMTPSEFKIYYQKKNLLMPEDRQYRNSSKFDKR